MVSLPARRVVRTAPDPPEIAPDAPDLDANRVGPETMTDDLSLPILFADEDYVAVHKPPGMLVHRTHKGCLEPAVLQVLRDQLGHRIYPVHRLDRGTSGALVFGRTPQSAAELSEHFRDRTIDKCYRAIVRGYLEPTEDVIDAPIREGGEGPRRDAVSEYRRLAIVELPQPVGRYHTARYSLVELRPRTGRTHQLRLHMAHRRHPIVGDVRHGDGRHNRLFRDAFGCRRLLLWAVRLSFTHPRTGRRVDIVAPEDPELRRLCTALGWPVPGSPEVAPH